MTRRIRTLAVLAAIVAAIFAVEAWDSNPASTAAHRLCNEALNENDWDFADALDFFDRCFTTIYDSFPQEVDQ